MLKRSIEILLTAALVTISPLSATAQNERPAVLRAQVYVENGFIVSDLTSGDLFSEQIIGTVESGMPTVVELLFRLMNNRDKAVGAGVRAYEVGYDVWEDRYVVKATDSTSYFTTFPAMGAAIENLKRIRLVPISSVEDDADYTVQFSVAVHPLRSRDREDMVEWMGENMDEVDTSKRQMLNLNDLIQHFFKREKEVSNRSPWFKTDMFRPGRLPVRSAPPKAGGDDADPNRDRERNPNGDGEGGAGSDKGGTGNDGTSAARRQEVRL